MEQVFGMDTIKFSEIPKYIEPTKYIIYNQK